MNRRTLLIITAVLAIATAQADDGRRPMLQQGKTWWYTLHHYEASDGIGNVIEYLRPVAYKLQGDTAINSRQYMKVFRTEYTLYGDEMSSSYYAAYREEDGKVYEVNARKGNTDRLLLDFSLKFDGEGFAEAVPIEDSIKVEGKFFRRYRYDAKRDDGSTYRTGFVGVEGVGFETSGLVQRVIDPQEECLCDYESFSHVTGGFRFSINDFGAPTWITLSEDERAFLERNNNFAIELFREVRGEQNIVLSPLSVTYALGLLNNGAAGQTAEEINNVLGAGKLGTAAINAFCRKMMAATPDIDPNTRVNIANTIFVNAGQGYLLQDVFTKTANAYYDAQPQSRDFKDGETREVINQWASDHTEGMVHEVLTEDDFDPGAVSYLLNAIYFKGAWKEKFDRKLTVSEPFNGGDDVPMMRQEATRFEYTDNDMYQAVKLPYGNGGFTMTVILPQEDKSVADVMAAMDGKNWQFSTHEQKVDLKLPRFDTDADINLAKAMENLGMPRAFDRLNAEFPSFCNTDIYIALMKQVAKISVSEEGTEAAAVTVIGEAAGDSPYRETFHATRPFLYIISEGATGCIFFIGQFTGNTTAGIDSRGIVEDRPAANTGLESKIYNMAGQRLATPPTRGLYIKDGKKVMK